MTKEEAIAKLTNMMNHCYPNEEYKMAIKALEQKPCEDAISREPFTDSTICEGFSCNECSFNRKDKGGCILEERVKALPSVTPQPKTGRWITDKFGQIICSECNGLRRDNRLYHMAYCNKCGAKMQ